MRKTCGQCEDKIDNLLSVEWDNLKEVEKSLRVPQPPTVGAQ